MQNKISAFFITVSENILRYRWLTRLTVLVMLLCWDLSASAQLEGRGHYSDFDDDYEVSGFLIAIYAIIAVVIIGFLGFLWLTSFWGKHKEDIKSFFSTCLEIAFCLLVGYCVFKICSSLTDSSCQNPTPSTPSTENIQAEPLSLDEPQETTPVYTPTYKIKEVEYTETCMYCGGKGQTLCSKCNGTGYIESTCTHCGGRGNFGRSTCGQCRGTGEVESVDMFSSTMTCYICYGKGYKEGKCDFCGGSGKKSEICDFDAAGLNHKTHYVACSHCYGTGKIKLTRLEGYYE